MLGNPSISPPPVTPEAIEKMVVIAPKYGGRPKDVRMHGMGYKHGFNKIGISVGDYLRGSFSQSFTKIRPTGR